MIICHARISFFTDQPASESSSEPVLVRWTLMPGADPVLAVARTVIGYVTALSPNYRAGSAGYRALWDELGRHAGGSYEQVGPARIGLRDLPPDGLAETRVWAAELSDEEGALVGAPYSGSGAEVYYSQLAIYALIRSGRSLLGGQATILDEALGQLCEHHDSGVFAPGSRKELAECAGFADRLARAFVSLGTANGPGPLLPSVQDPSEPKTPMAAAAPSGAVPPPPPPPPPPDALTAPSPSRAAHWALAICAVAVGVAAAVGVLWLRHDSGTVDPVPKLHGTAAEQEAFRAEFATWDASRRRIVGDAYLEFEKAAAAQRAISEQGDGVRVVTMWRDACADLRDRIGDEPASPAPALRQIDDRIEKLSGDCVEANDEVLRSTKGATRARLDALALRFRTALAGLAKVSTQVEAIEDELKALPDPRPDASS